MKRTYEAVVIGSSSGGITGLTLIIPKLPADFIPVMMVQHMREDDDNFLACHLDKQSKMHVKEAQADERLQKGTAYIAPPGYHLLVEKNHTLSLSANEKIHFARPSIDVLFESAADVFCDRLIGIVLSGANADGSDGLKQIKDYGGLAIVQDPKTAEAPYMPEAALKVTPVDHVLSLEKISEFLLGL